MRDMAQKRGSCYTTFLYALGFGLALAGALTSDGVLFVIGIALLFVVAFMTT